MIEIKEIEKKIRNYKFIDLFAGIGRFQEKQEMDKAIKSLDGFSSEYSSIIDRVFLEVIGENEESVIEEIIVFGNKE